MMINQFKGEYRWLSNFYLTDITYQGILYPSTENAYQAAKTRDREQFTLISPSMARQLGQRVTLREDWESVKLAVMRDLQAIKFSDASLRIKLLATWPKQLIEGNRWRDKFWGVDLDTNTGQNHLGKILMEIREDKR